MGAMNVQTPAARDSDPLTSHAAAKEITESGERQRQIRAVAGAVRRNPGLTSADLAAASGMDRHLLGKRLPEAQLAGLVRTGDKVMSKSTDRLGMTWWPA